MRRFVTLFILLLFAIPFGVSISGCSKNAAPTFCNGASSGIVTGQATTISLTPVVYGISLNYAQIGQLSTPSASDCKGSNASVGTYTYGTTDMTVADVQPTTGRLCAGTWNRNSGGGIPDYTVCNPTGKPGTAYVSASADGVTSNPIPIFVHPVVTSIVLGGPSSNCSTDPSTACCPLTTVGAVTAAPYAADSCLSQGKTAQLVARIYAGDPAIPANNISCQAGHLQFSSQGSSSGDNSQVVTIDQNGVATANQPGSVLISANVANAASSAGFFSTCPPVSIALTAPGTTAKPGAPVFVNQNNTQPLLATAVDKNNVTLTGLSLEYVSTAPTTIPGSASGSVTPILAGAASISAVCQPPNCNSSSYNQIGLFGNGKPVTSNSVAIVTPGTNGTVLYMASTQSKYLVVRDFTQTGAGAPFLLPYVPNSMIISNDGSTIYLGSATALMVVNAINTLSLSRADITSPGAVLAVSPDGSKLVISDPVKQVTTLEASAGGIISTYGGVGTHAQFASDSQTVYITTGTVITQATTTSPAVLAPSAQVLIYSNFTGWTPVTNPVPASDVAITTPSVGAYFAGATNTVARSYCAISTPTSPTTESNSFYPLADRSAVATDRIAATNDGLHILGAAATSSAAALSDLKVQIPDGNIRGTAVSIACPAVGTLAFSNTPSTTILSPISATAITGVLPASDSSVAFVTYTGSGGVLPVYTPATGQTTYTRLSPTASSTPTAPIAGVISADNTIFYAGTSGDNLVHLVTPGTPPGTWIDTSTIAPNLLNPANVVVPVDLLAQKPRKTT